MNYDPLFHYLVLETKAAYEQSESLESQLNHTQQCLLQHVDMVNQLEARNAFLEQELYQAKRERSNQLSNYLRERFRRIHWENQTTSVRNISYWKTLIMELFLEKLRTANCDFEQAWQDANQFFESEIREHLKKHQEIRADNFWDAIAESDVESDDEEEVDLIDSLLYNDNE